MNEADTCRTYVLPKLKSAGWEDETITEQLVLTPGKIVPIGDRHTRKEGLRPDYVLFIRQNIPIAVAEAKAEYAHSGAVTVPFVSPRGLPLCGVRNPRCCRPTRG
jgi:type I restriction enzyme R subunit